MTALRSIALAAAAAATLASVAPAFAKETSLPKGSVSVTLSVPGKLQTMKPSAIADMAQSATCKATRAADNAVFAAVPPVLGDVEGFHAQFVLKPGTYALACTIPPHAGTFSKTDVVVPSQGTLSMQVTSTASI